MKCGGVVGVALRARWDTLPVCPVGLLQFRLKHAHSATTRLQVVHQQLKRVGAQPQAAAVGAGRLGKGVDVQVLGQRDGLQLLQLLFRG
jgi:hypothetical protein